MTPKEKAKELFDKMFEKCGQPFRVDEDVNGTNEAKQCALIAVDEIIINLVTIVKTTLNSPLDLGLGYWQEVKQEINKL